MIIKNNDLIIICNEEIDNEIFDLFSKKVINEFTNVRSWFNIEHNHLTLTLVSKREIDLIAKEKSMQYKNIDVPDWLVGFSTFEEVWVVIPTKASLDELSKVALHELVHLISYKLDTSNKRIKLLQEGIAVFLSNQYEGKIYIPWVRAYLKNALPKLSYFCTYDGMEFAKKRWLSVLLSYYRIFIKCLW